jgi:hypothetical protein
MTMTMTNTNTNTEQLSLTTNTTSTQSHSPNTHSQPLPLPAPNTAVSTRPLDLSTATTTITTTIKLDHLGPLVVNADGTISRIANWDAMSEIERNNTVRVLGKRNRARKEALGLDATDADAKDEAEKLEPGEVGRVVGDGS